MTNKIFKRGDNLRFIADYLLENPGARYTELTKALCEFRGRGWDKGAYCRYFTYPSRWNTSATCYPDNLWEKTPCGGWMLTVKGMGYATPSHRR